MAAASSCSLAVDKNQISDWPERKFLPQHFPCSANLGTTHSSRQITALHVKCCVPGLETEVEGVKSCRASDVG